MKVEKNHLKNRRTSFASAKGLVNGAFLLSSMFLAGACSNEFDDYYETPDWLEDDAYAVLQSKGNFSNYLKLVDKTKFSAQVKGSGSYTFFAPNDSAFNVWLKEKGYASVDDVPEKVASDIVSYTMVYNQYEASHLGDIWAGALWEDGLSMRKQTPYYKGIYKDDPLGTGDSAYVYDNYYATFAASTQDHAYLPIYTPEYFAKNSLTSQDYASTHKVEFGAYGNVLDAKILSADIYASNGVVHELDKVVEPPYTIDQMMVNYAQDGTRATQGWAKLKEYIYNRFADGSYQFLSFTEMKDAAIYYAKMYPELEAELGQVYSRQYDVAALGIAPNSNMYISNQDARQSETSAYTLFLPSEEAWAKYEDELLKYTADKNFNSLSTTVLENVLRSHVARDFVWPSQFKGAKNTAATTDGEFINGKGVNGGDFNYNKVELAANGIVYHIDEVIESALFKSVYGRVLLDPAYSYTLTQLGTAALYTSLVTHTPFSTGENPEGYQYTVCLASDALFQNDQIRYDNLNSTFAWNEGWTQLGSTNAPGRINRLINSGMFIRELGADDYSTPRALDFKQPAALAGAYDGWGFAVNYAGEMVRYRDDQGAIQLQAIGNIQDGTVVTLTEDPESYVNGKVYTMDRLLQYTPRETQGDVTAGWDQSANVLADVKTYLAAHPECSLFKKYFDVLYDNNNAALVGYVGTADMHTILIPTDEYMQEAIDKGYLPRTVDGFADATASPDSMTAAANFLLGHFLQGAIYADDGEDRIYLADKNYSQYFNSTAIRLTEPSLGLMSAKTSVSIDKFDDPVDGQQNKLRFLARNVQAGESNTSVVIGYVSEKGSNAVIRDIEKSNVMAARLSVIHQLDGFLYFHVNKPEVEEEVVEGEESDNV